MKSFHFAILTLTTLFTPFNLINSQSSSPNNTWQSSKYIGYNSGIPSGDLYFKTNGATRASITSGLGYFGIGTQQPIFRMHVDGDLFITGTRINNAPGTASLLFGDNNIQPEFGLEYNGGGLNFWKPFGSANGTGGNGFGNYFLFIKDNGKVGIHTNNPTADLTIDGNMLIGNSMITLPPGYKLYVESGIITEKVKVAIHNSSEWSDHVFSDDYSLLPLTELAQYVKSEHHLPGVPSAGNVVNEGLDLAKMDAILLEKIEEIILYLITQDETINNLRIKNNILEMEITKLRTN